MRDVLTFILAGGKGERLNPLTRDRAKPAVPFGGIYRIIDFTLSNCINSGLRRIYVLIQYKSFSLQKHLIAGWRDIVSSQLGEFIDVIPAQQRVSSDWYRGTADAIYQNIYAIQDHDPDLVLILAGDHIYKMNYQEMIDFHKAWNADVTVACIPMPVDTSVHFGVLEVDKHHQIQGFQEKPRKPKTIPGNPKKIFASMGIYLFSKEALLRELNQDSKAMSDHDFGKNVIPQMLKNGRRVFAYNFTDDDGRPKYWRDIGTRDAYYQANMDLVKPQPEFNMYDRQWPVRTLHEQFPPVKTVSIKGRGKAVSGTVTNSIIGGGSIIRGAEVKGSVISANVKVGEKSSIVNSVIMGNVTIGEGAKIKNAIIDKEVNILPDARIGYDLKKDRRLFDVTKSGIVIVAKKTTIKK